MLVKRIEKVNPVEAAEIKRGKIGIDEMCVLDVVCAFYFIGKVGQCFAFFHTVEMSAGEACADAADLAHAGANVQDPVIGIVNQEFRGFHGNAYRREMPGRVFLVLPGIDGIELQVAGVFFLLEELKNHPANVVILTVYRNKRLLVFF